MGAPMARNLATAGHDVLAYNRTRERAEPLAADGIAVAGDAAEAVRGADVVVTMLSDGDAVAVARRAALGALDGAVWAQMSTVGVDGRRAPLAWPPTRASRSSTRRCRAPSSPAEQGEAVVLASGPRDARERCAPVFDAVGAKTVVLGDEPGAGTRMKLVAQHVAARARRGARRVDRSWPRASASTRGASSRSSTAARSVRPTRSSRAR